MKKIIYGIAALAILIAIGYSVFNWIGKKPSPAIVINSFEECASAGYKITESYPRKCIAPDGRTFVENIPIVSEIILRCRRVS